MKIKFWCKSFYQNTETREYAMITVADYLKFKYLDTLSTAFYAAYNVFGYLAHAFSQTAFNIDADYGKHCEHLANRYDWTVEGAKNDDGYESV